MSRRKAAKAAASTTRHEADTDTAGIALSQAAAIIDLLTVAVEGIAIPETYPRTLNQSLYAALSEVQRAQMALFGVKQ